MVIEHRGPHFVTLSTQFEEQNVLVNIVFNVKKHTSYMLYRVNLPISQSTGRKNTLWKWVVWNVPWCIRTVMWGSTHWCVTSHRGQVVIECEKCILWTRGVHLLYFCMVAQYTLNWNIKCYSNRCWCSENPCVVHEVPLPDLVGAWCAVSPCKIIGLTFFEEIWFIYSES